MAKPSQELAVVFLRLGGRRSLAAARTRCVDSALPELSSELGNRLGAASGQGARREGPGLQGLLRDFLSPVASLSEEQLGSVWQLAEGLRYKR